MRSAIIWWQLSEKREHHKVFYLDTYRHFCLPGTTFRALQSFWKSSCNFKVFLGKKHSDESLCFLLIMKWGKCQILTEHCLQLLSSMRIFTKLRLVMKFILSRVLFNIRIFYALVGSDIDSVLKLCLETFKI